MKEILNKILESCSESVDELLKHIPTFSVEQPSFNGFPIHVNPLLTDRQIYFISNETQWNPKEAVLPNGFHMSPKTYDIFVRQSLINRLTSRALEELAVEHQISHKRAMKLAESDRKQAKIAAKAKRKLTHAKPATV